MRRISFNYTCAIWRVTLPTENAAYIFGDLVKIIINILQKFHTYPSFAHTLGRIPGQEIPPVGPMHNQFNYLRSIVKSSCHLCRRLASGLDPWHFSTKILCTISFFAIRLKRPLPIKKTSSIWQSFGKQEIYYGRRKIIVCLLLLLSVCSEQIYCLPHKAFDFACLRSFQNSVQIPASVLVLTARRF